MRHAAAVQLRQNTRTVFLILYQNVWEYNKHNENGMMPMERERRVSIQNKRSKIYRMQKKEIGDTQTAR